MSYPKPIRLDGLLAKVESEEGTDASPTPADDGIRIAERIWSAISSEWAFPNRRDDVATGSLEVAAPGPRAGKMATVEIPWEARGIGSAYSSTDLPEASPLFRACPLSETVDPTAGAETVTYARADESLESCTIYAYAGGKEYVLVGCRGTFRWPVTAGELGVLRFTMQGLVVSVTEASVPSITYDSQKPAAAKGMTLTLDAWTPDMLTSEFNFGAEVQRLSSGTAGDAISGFHPSVIAPSYNLSARAVAKATFDPHSADDGETPIAITQRLGAGGDGESYNRLTLTGTGYLENVENNDDNAFAAWELPFQMSAPELVFD